MTILLFCRRFLIKLSIFCFGKLIKRLRIFDSANFQRKFFFRAIFFLDSIEKRTKIIKVISTITKTDAIIVMNFLDARAFFADKFNGLHVLNIIHIDISPINLQIFRSVLVQRLILFH